MKQLLLWLDQVIHLLGDLLEQSILIMRIILC